MRKKKKEYVFLKLIGIFFPIIVVKKKTEFFSYTWEKVYRKKLMLF